MDDVGWLELTLRLERAQSGTMPCQLRQMRPAASLLFAARSLKMGRTMPTYAVTGASGHLGASWFRN